MSPNSASSAPSATCSSRDRNSQQPERSSPEPPRGQKRKQRTIYSCADCRRLKLKCDREFPCANCVRRRRAHFCPDGKATRPISVEEYNTLLESKVTSLQKVLTRHGIDGEIGPRGRTSSEHTETHASPPRQAPDQDPEPASPPSATRETGPDTSSVEVQEPPPLNDVPSMEVLFDLGTSAEPFVPSGDHALDAYSGPFEGSADYDHSLPERSGHVPQRSPSPPGLSYGTLVISDSGRSKYLGPTAASDWLKDQELEETNVSLPHSRAISPEPSDDVFGHNLGSIPAGADISSFPFSPILGTVSTEFLLSKLPVEEVSRGFIDAYYKYYSWHFNVCPRQQFDNIFDRVYREMVPSRGSARSASPQELALVFITLASGVLYDIEVAPNDPLANELYRLAKSCLVKGRFLVNNTLAGVQALHIMAHYCLQTEEGRNGDTAWPLWGLSMRIVQAMGLHRDGTRWNLRPDIVDIRRNVFWECHTADTMQANCFSRPATLTMNHIDCMFPEEQSPALKSFNSLKWDLGIIAGEINNLALSVRAPPYATILALQEQLVVFEQNIPFHLRCRAALQAQPSRYLNPETAALTKSPEESKREIHKTFQQFTLALNVCEVMLCLHRTYYVRAIHEPHADPTLSVYGQSYLTVVERCNVIVQIVTRLHALHPNITVRHWYYWHHLFNAAVCAGTLILQNPHNPLTPFALGQINQAIALYTLVVQVHGPSDSRVGQNLHWLLRLRQRTEHKIENVDSPHALQTSPQDTNADDVELLGWRTRLVQRAARGRVQTVTTVSQPSPTTLNIPSSAQDGSNVPATANTSPSTEDLLHEFWKPHILHDIPDLAVPSTFNWFNFDLDPLPEGL